MEEEKDLQPLNNEEVMERLKMLPGWELTENKIIKTFEFPNFSDAVFMLTHLAPYCNKIDHHPDIIINYKKITFELTRYSIGGKLTERDFTVAKKIESLFQRFFIL